MSEKHTPLSSLGEFGLIDHLTNSFETKQQSTIKGIGDDAAVINHEGLCTVLSTDLLIEGVHFDLSFMPLKHLGYKAVVVNLSDIYAMNASPSQITISLAISNRFSVEALDELYAGIKHACDTYGVDLVGGDTTSSSTGLSISVTAVGAAKKKDLVYRNGAKEGDFICVSGELGGAYIGLQLLNREKEVFLENPKMQPKLDEHKYLVGRQLKPEARKDVIETLAGLGIKPTSMIDISDGLSSEILHICKQSEVGCRLYEEKIPVDESVYKICEEMNLNATTIVLGGGEDYELLFTAPIEDHKKIETNPNLTIIGHITEAEDGVNMVTRGDQLIELTAQGWNSFDKE